MALIAEDLSLIEDAADQVVALVIRTRRPAGEKSLTRLSAEELERVGKSALRIIEHAREMERTASSILGNVGDALKAKGF